ncbi:hypothetical protein GCM10009633_27200 [Janibacter melonis]
MPAPPPSGFSVPMTFGLAIAVLPLVVVMGACVSVLMGKTPMGR